MTHIEPPPLGWAVVDGPRQEGDTSAEVTDARYRTGVRESAQWESLPATASAVKSVTEWTLRFKRLSGVG